MRFLELGTWALTGLLVVGVIALIFVNSVLGISLAPHEVSVDEVDAIFGIYNKTWQSVDAPDVRGQGPLVRFEIPTSMKDGASGRSGRSGDGKRGEGSGRGEEAPGAAGSGPGGSGSAPDGYDRSSGGGGQNWTTSDNGLPEAPPVYLPPVLVERYQHAQEARDALMSAESFDIPFDGGTAVRLGRMGPDSPLSKYLGLQPNDVVISVNGNAVSKSNGMDLHGRLKNEKRFRVEIQRGGARFIAKYEIR